MLPEKRFPLLRSIEAASIAPRGGCSSPPTFRSIPLLSFGTLLWTLHHISLKGLKAEVTLYAKMAMFDLQ